MEDEIFNIDPEFFATYSALLTKYNFNPSNYIINNQVITIDTIIDDFKVQLKCDFVELINVDSEKLLNSIKYCGAETSILKNEIFTNEIKNKLDGIQFAEKYRGDSFTLKNINISGIHYPIIEIDIVSVPNHIDTNGAYYIFIFINSQILKNPLKKYRAERNFQRLILAELIIDWWMKITFSRPTNSIFDSGYAISISDLLCIGLNSSVLARENPNLFFKGETLDKVFDWKLWNPGLIFFNQNEESANYIRKYSKSLIYWCRWINLHLELEKEIDKELAEKNLKWINAQRQEYDTIENHIDELQKLCAKEFCIKNFIFNLNSGQNKNLSLQNKSLLIFSLNKWIGHKTNFRKELFTENVLSNIEFCRSLHAIGSISHYLFCQQNFTEDINHRLMQLISNYGHSELGIPFRIDLRAHLLHAARAESALYVLKAFYRDHFFHAIEVCFLGHFILEIEVEKGKYFWEIVANKLNIKGKKKVLQLWYIASLLHDVGYAIDMFNNSQRHLEFFRHSKAINNLTTQIKSIKENLIDTDEVKYLEIGKPFKGMENDHGIIGALHLQSLIKSIEEEDDKVQIEDFKPAIQAIALHNLRKKDNKISFSKNPIAFLLAFCDQIQEWNRIKMPYSTSPNIILSSLVENGIKNNNSIGGICNVVVNSVTSNETNGEIEIKLNNNKLEFTLEYDDRINKNSNVFGLWLDSTLNFQRFELEELPFDLKVNFKTPYFCNETLDVKTPQLHRLRNAAYETHMSFLSDWFPNEKNGKILTNGAVEYSQNGETELLSLDLKKLAKKRRVTKDMGAFYTQLSKWKHYYDDKEFPGDYVAVHPE